MNWTKKPQVGISIPKHCIQQRTYNRMLKDNVDTANANLKETTSAIKLHRCTCTISQQRRKYLDLFGSNLFNKAMKGKNKERTADVVVQGASGDHCVKETTIRKYIVSGKKPKYKSPDKSLKKPDINAKYTDINDKNHNINVKKPDTNDKKTDDKNIVELWKGNKDDSEGQNDRGSVVKLKKKLSCFCKICKNGFCKSVEKAKSHISVVIKKEKKLCDNSTCLYSPKNNDEMIIAPSYQIAVNKMDHVRVQKPKTKKELKKEEAEKKKWLQNELKIEKTEKERSKKKDTKDKESSKKESKERESVEKESKKKESKKKESRQKKYKKKDKRRVSSPGQIEIQPEINVTLETGTLKLLNAEEVRKKIDELNKGTCRSGPCRESYLQNEDYECRCQQRRRRSKNYHKKNKFDKGMGSLCEECGDKCPHKELTCECCKKVCKQGVCTCGCKANLIGTFEDFVLPKADSLEETRRQMLQKNVQNKVQKKKPSPRSVCSCNKVMRERMRRKMRRAQKKIKNVKEKYEGIEKTAEQKAKEKRKRAKNFESRMKATEKLRARRAREHAKWEDEQIAQLNATLGKKETNCLWDCFYGTFKCAVGLAFAILILVLRTISKPKQVYWYLKGRLRNPEDTAYLIKNWFVRRWRLQSLKIHHTIAGSKCLQVLQDELLSLKIVKTLFSKAKNAKEEKMAKLIEKKRAQRMKEREKVLRQSCKYMQLKTMRETPCLCVYMLCPSLYPQCLRLIKVYRQLCSMFAFCAALIIWTPCIIAVELCRGLICCTMCTA